MKTLEVGTHVKVKDPSSVWNADLRVPVPSSGVIEEVINSQSTGLWYKLEGDDVHRYYPGNIEHKK